MHFVLKTNIDTNSGSFISNEIVGHVSSGIAAAQAQLINCIKTFVTELAGKDMANSLKVIDIHSMDQVSEPIIDTLLLYRLESDPHTIHVYQRKSSVVSGSLWGEKIKVDFNKIKIFSLVEYDKVSPPPPPPSRSQSERTLTISHKSPIPTETKHKTAEIDLSPSKDDLILSLKSSPIFKKKFEESLGRSESSKRIINSPPRKIIMMPHTPLSVGPTTVVEMEVVTETESLSESVSESVSTESDSIPTSTPIQPESEVETMQFNLEMPLDQN